MSVEDHKQIIKRNAEELYIKGELSVADETLTEDYTHDGVDVSGREDAKKRIASMIADTDRAKLTRVEFHEMIGEGDKLAVLQTNHMADGKQLKIASFHTFEGGKLASTKVVY